jgi:hypothetical protein
MYNLVGMWKKERKRNSIFFCWFSISFFISLLSTTDIMSKYAFKQEERANGQFLLNIYYPSPKTNQQLSQDEPFVITLGYLLMCKKELDHLRAFLPQFKNDLKHFDFVRSLNKLNHQTPQLLKQLIRGNNSESILFPIKTGEFAVEKSIIDIVDGVDGDNQASEENGGLIASILALRSKYGFRPVPERQSNDLDLQQHTHTNTDSTQTENDDEEQKEKETDTSPFLSRDPLYLKELEQHHKLIQSILKLSK